MGLLQRSGLTTSGMPNGGVLELAFGEKTPKAALSASGNDTRVLDGGKYLFIRPPMGFL